MNKTTTAQEIKSPPLATHPITRRRLLMQALRRLEDAQGFEEALGVPMPVTLPPNEAAVVASILRRAGIHPASLNTTPTCNPLCHASRN